MTTTFVVPDIHGRHDLLTQALGMIQDHADEPGTVVFLGDYIDRGPQSAAVLARLMAGPPPGWRWVCLMGNHEAMMLEVIGTARESWWLGNGGDATLQCYGGPPPQADRDWCAGLARLHTDAHRIYVHAAIDPHNPPDAHAQDEEILLWHRYGPRDVQPVPGYHVVHGHTPNADGPILLAGRTNLDTGAFFTGRLDVGVFDDATPGGPVEIMTVRA